MSKRYYTFTVRENFAGTRVGEIELTSDDIEGFADLTEEERIIDAEQVAYDKFQDGNITWEESTEEETDDPDIELQSEDDVDEDD